MPSTYITERSPVKGHNFRLLVILIGVAGENECHAMKEKELRDERSLLFLKILQSISFMLMKNGCSSMLSRRRYDVNSALGI